ncbi:hypothetical protein [Bradyrhizobium cenepequi]
MPSINTPGTAAHHTRRVSSSVEPATPDARLSEAYRLLLYRPRLITPNLSSILSRRNHALTEHSLRFTAAFDALFFARRIDGIDSIATGDWTIQFRGRILLVCKGIRKMTTYHAQGGGR